MPQPILLIILLFQVKYEKYGNYFNIKRFGFFFYWGVWQSVMMVLFLRSKAILSSFLNEESRQSKNEDIYLNKSLGSSESHCLKFCGFFHFGVSVLLLQKCIGRFKQILWIASPK